MTHLFDDLRAIQARCGWLPGEELAALAERRRLPLYALHGVASFYPRFRLAPPPRLEVQVCQDLACHLGGAERVRAALAGAAGDGVRVQAASCLGRCERPVAAAFGHDIHDALDPERAQALLARTLAGSRPEPDARPCAPRFPGLDPYAEAAPGGALRTALAAGRPEEVIAALKASGLRGMGGAGFPTGAKWELVRSTPASTRYVICNADESEPGTFKDREVLARHPELVLEGMAIAAWVVGASEGIVYIRHEYQREAAALREAIDRFLAAGLLGSHAFGSGHGFSVTVFESPGGYICGEETALLEALEGKRAEPRNKPPFPGTHGLWGKPTVINNVETFAFVPAILLKGAEWFRSQGRNGGQGLKLIALSGHVARPGVYEVPMGLPAIELIEGPGGGVAGGRALKAFSPGGASSGFLPAALATTPLEFGALARAGSMLGSGAVVAVAEGTCMLDLALNGVRFFRNESCGKCVPCRAGTARLVTLLEGFARGEGAPEDLAVVDELAEAMKDTSICGLGQAAALPATSVLRHWRDEVDAHVLGRRCPSGTCPVRG